MISKQIDDKTTQQSTQPVAERINEIFSRDKFKSYHSSGNMIGGQTKKRQKTVQLISFESPFV